MWPFAFLKIALDTLNAVGYNHWTLTGDKRCTLFASIAMALGRGLVSLPRGLKLGTLLPAFRLKRRFLSLFDKGKIMAPQIKKLLDSEKFYLIYRSDGAEHSGPFVHGQAQVMHLSDPEFDDLIILNEVQKQSYFGDDNETSTTVPQKERFKGL